MSTYTQAERHEIYKKAKEFFQRNLIRSGMCDHVAIVCKFRGGLIPDLNMFPELLVLKPEKPRGVYWWNLDDRETRLKNFDLIIEQTKP